MADYAAALLCEIEMEAPAYDDYEVRTVFFGGGTPSVLAAEDVERILCKLREMFHFAGNNEVEITIEVNPGTITGVVLKKYQEIGINRISFGLQSAHDDELKLLGRIHTYGEFLSLYQEARALGFGNLNIDLISALPNQSFASFKETLRRVTSLKPEHISAYSLIIEPNTPFYEKYAFMATEAGQMAAEEKERKIYYHTKSYLESKNIMRYEISNYAKPGFECQHNLTYWRRGDYVGFGLGAASLVDNKRWSNSSDLKMYNLARTSLKEKLQVLSLKEQMEEFMFLGLRLTEGININHFKNIFAQDINECYGSVLLKLKEQNLIQISDHIILTGYGVDVSNYVFTQFLWD